MKACITIVGNEIFGSFDRQKEDPVRIALSAETLTRLSEWTGRYDRAAFSRDHSLLAGLGSEIFSFLDQTGWASQWIKASGDLVLEVAVDLTEETLQTAHALLDLPWEILAHENKFLAEDPHRLYIVQRTINPDDQKEPCPPKYCDIESLFMATAPATAKDFDFVAQEAALLTITRDLPIELSVEESGCKHFLKNRIRYEGPFDTIHICCNGKTTQDQGPVMVFETPQGEESLIDAREFARILGRQNPQLICLNALSHMPPTTESQADLSLKSMELLARTLVKTNAAPNILIGGALSAPDATCFARLFYQELTNYAAPPYAVAVVRQKMLSQELPSHQKGPFWHQARLYTGPLGGKAVCVKDGEKRNTRQNAGFYEFLDKVSNQVAVPSFQEFVGRRRTAQQVFRFLAEKNAAGVLIYGMRNLGKSSLAARIANRLFLSDHKTAVIYERYDGLAIFDRFLDSLSEEESLVWEEKWRARIAADTSLLFEALKELLEGPFCLTPMLLIIDDLDQILEDPRRGQQEPFVKIPWRRPITSVLRAFKEADTPSKLLVTSRYDFSLKEENGDDPAKWLIAMQLPPMTKIERRRQWQAAEHHPAELEKRSGVFNKVHFADPDLVDRIIDASGGNPGLQEILCRPLLNGEPESARKALEAVLKWKSSGKQPKEETVAQEFFRRASYPIYANALESDQITQLRAGTLFGEETPVPRRVFEAVGEALGVKAPQKALDRLLALGLVYPWQHLNYQTHLSLQPLASPLAQPGLKEKKKIRLATVALPLLIDAWQNEEGDFPTDSRSIEIVRLALMGKDHGAIIGKAAMAAGNFLLYRRREAKRAHELLTAAQKYLEGSGYARNQQLTTLISHCAEYMGQT